MKKISILLMLMALFGPLAMMGQTTLLTQNFDGNGLALYDNTYDSRGWYTYNAGNGNNWELYQHGSSYAHSGNYDMCYAYNSDNAANCYLVSEPFSVSAGMSRLSVSLYEKVEGSYFAETFEVFFVKASDVTTLAAVTSATHYSAIASASYTNTSWAEKSGSTTNSALAGQSVRVVVHCTSAKDKYRLYIDDITVTETTGAVSTYTVTYNANGGTGTMTDPNSPYTSGSTVTVMSNAFTAPTDMTFSGWNTAANGSGTSYAPGDHFNISANTTLYAQWAAPCDYFEDFENVSGASSGYSSAGSLPTGWDQIYTGTVNSTTAQAPHVHNGSSYPGPGSGTNALSGYYLGFYGTGNNSNSYAIMPAFASNEAANHISFKYRYESTSNGTLSYGVIDGTDASTYVVLGTCSTSTNPGLVDVDLSTSQTAGKRLAFRWAYSASSWYTAAIDDICVMTESTSNCPTPTITNITPGLNTAVISTDSDAENFNVQYRVVSASATPIIYDFEDGTFSGWTYYDNDGDSKSWIVTDALGSYTSGETYVASHGGAYYLRSTYNSNALVENWLISPQFKLGGSISFYIERLNGYDDYYKVYVSTTGTSISDFTVEVQGEREPAASYELVTIDLSNYSGDGYVAIKHYAKANDQAYLFLDDVTIIEGVENPWQTANDLTLTGLNPETTYQVQVQADCGSEDGVSSWSSISTFTTLSACTTPTGLTAEVTGNSAALSWTGFADTYNIQYREVLEPDPTAPVTLILNVPTDIWGDGTGYQLVLDADHNTYGSTISTNGSFTAGTFSDFEYTIPENAVCSLTTNTIVVDGSASITIPAGVYDYAFLNPDGSSTYWIASSNGNFPGRGDDYEFEAGKTYEFTIYESGTGDAVDVTISAPTSTAAWTTVQGVTNPYTLYNLNPTTTYEFQVQGAECDNWSASATFTTTNQFVKHIIGYNSEEGNGSGNYYLIASPIGQVAPTNVTNMVNSNHTGYDLFYFDQSQDLEWITYKPSGTVAPLFNLVSGKGYLYANSQTVDLVFNGSNGNYVTNGEVTISLDYVDTAPNNGTYNIDLPGWNLVGNPFAVTAYPNRSFYTMDSDGSAFVAITNGSVEAMEGIFVQAQATETDPTVTFSTTDPNAKSPTLALNLINTTTGSSHIIDRAIVRFDQGDQLHKFQLFKNSTKVYIPKEGQDYAIVCSEEIGEMPVNFKAEDNGTYTLNLSVDNVEFGYLHLIDNKTGMDIDLLQTPSYTFEAKTTDYESRFKLVFATGDNSKDDNFAYFSNGSFVINNDGEATLQVIDIMGRILKSESINGCANMNVNAAPGVYMLRLVNGDNVKVQKVVVK